MADPIPHSAEGAKRKQAVRKSERVHLFCRYFGGRDGGRDSTERKRKRERERESGESYQIIRRSRELGKWRWLLWRAVLAFNILRVRVSECGYLYLVC